MIMKPCLKVSSSMCSHRKCVAFGPQEIHIADEWDRTPTEPTRRLTYTDLLELKEIQRSLPHANQPYEGKHFLSTVPISLLPLLDTPPSSATSSTFSSRSSSPPPSLLDTLDNSPHSSPDPNPFLPLLSDDPDPQPSTFPIRFPGSIKKPKKFILVNDIEIPLDDSDSDYDSDIHHHDPPPSALFSHTNVTPRISRSCDTLPRRFPPPSPKTTPTPSPTSINVHIPVVFKRPRGCSNPRPPNPSNTLTPPLQGV